MKVTQTTDTDRQACAARKEGLLRQLRDMLPICRGSIHPFRKPASGKGKAKQGREYYSWERWIDGRRVSATLRVDQVEHIRAGIAGYQAFTHVVRELAAAMEEEHLSAAAWQETARPGPVKKTADAAKGRSRTPSGHAGRQHGRKDARRWNGR